MRGVARSFRCLRAEAQENVERIIKELFNKEVFGIQQVSEAPEVRRMQWVTETLKEKGMRRSTIAGLLLLDWAARKPEATAAFLASLDELDATQEPHSVFAHFRSVCADDTRKTYWKGTLRILMGNFFVAVTDDELQSFGVCFESGSRLHAPSVFKRLVTFKYLDNWGAFAAMRAIAAALQLRIRDQTALAKNMSLNTSLMLTVFPTVKLGYFLHTVTGGRKDAAYVAFVACEVTKILRSEGVLDKLESYGDNCKSLCESLCSWKCQQLGDRIANMTVPSYESSLEVALLETMTLPAGKVSDTNISSRWRAIKVFNEPRAAAPMKRPASFS